MNVRDTGHDPSSPKLTSHKLDGLLMWWQASAWGPHTETEQYTTVHTSSAASPPPAPQAQPTDIYTV